MKVAEFPFARIGKTYLGEIFRPYALVEFGSDRINWWVPIQAVIDTGADYTLLPKRLSSFLGVDIASECIAQATQGVGGMETIYLLKKGVKIKIGKWQKEIPVGFLERDDIPTLLGRLECLEVFTLLLDKKKANFEI